MLTSLENPIRMEIMAEKVRFAVKPLKKSLKQLKEL